MNAVEFLRAVLPETGLYCIARGPFPFRGKAGHYFKHDGFPTIEDAAAFATRHSVNDNVYFTVHNLKGMVEEDYSGKKVLRAKREASNMLCVRSFYADIDCGPGKPYATKSKGVEALDAFTNDTGLPMPLVVSSGRGLHVYWPLVNEIASADWRVHALRLKALFKHHGFHCDPAVTADTVRILRVVGTFNRKDPANALKVQAISVPPERIPNAEFLRILDAACEMLPDPEVREEAARRLEAARPLETPENVETVKAMLENVNPDIGRDEWRQVVWAVLATGWNCAVQLAGDWSAKGETWNEAAFGTLVQSFDPSRGTTVGTLVHIARHHGYAGPGLAAEALPDLDGGRPTEVGGDVANGRRFAAAARSRFLYIYDTAGWFKFDPAFGWTTAQTVDVEAFAKDVIEAMSLEAAERWRRGPDDPVAKKLRQNVERTCRLPHMRAMIEMARSEPGMAASLADFDADPMRLGVLNGVVDLRTGKLLEATPELRVSKRCRVAFDPGAECPGFIKFLAEVLPDPEVRAFILRFMGYCLTGSVEEQAFIFFHGSGFNGKSVLIDLLAWVLGDYARKIPTEMLMLQQRSVQGPDPDILMLKGLRLAYSSETEDGRRLSEARVKDMTGGERLSARAPYATAPVEFVPTHKLLISGNHKPAISDTSHGMWRRVILLLFGVQIPEADRNPDLSENLRREGSGILNLALAGLRDWRAGRGLRVPASIKAATATYRAEQDVLGEFLAEECEVGHSFKVSKDALSITYGTWCDANRHRPLSANRLTRELAERGFKRVDGRRNISGLRMALP